MVLPPSGVPDVVVAATVAVAENAIAAAAVINVSDADVSVVAAAVTVAGYVAVVATSPGALVVENGIVVEERIAGAAAADFESMVVAG